jgi:hypothetical protein
MTGGVVASAPHGDLETLGSREVERGRDVGRARTAHDHSRATVDESIEAAPGGVISDFARGDDLSGDRRTELGHVTVDTGVVGHGYEKKLPRLPDSTLGGPPRPSDSRCPGA